MIIKHWDTYENMYQLIMGNRSMPYYFDGDKLYIITSWSLSTMMGTRNGPIKLNDGISNRAEGREIVSYGNK